MTQKKSDSNKRASYNQPLKLERTKGSTLFMDQVHDLDWYRECVLLGFGNMDWLDNHKKELYSVKDIENYMFSVFDGLEKSLTPDSKLSLEKQIRRVMKANFELPKIEKSYKYVLGKAETMYLVNTLMKSYLEKLIYPSIKKELTYDAVIKFYKFAYGKEWYKVLGRDIENAQKVNE